jgi:hypothetical protein
LHQLNSQQAWLVSGAINSVDATAQVTVKRRNKANIIYSPVQCGLIVIGLLCSLGQLHSHLSTNCAPRTGNWSLFLFIAICAFRQPTQERESKTSNLALIDALVWSVIPPHTG